MSNRFFEIDFFRGVALLMMIVFHFLWDLNFFGFTNISLYKGFWGLFQITTASTFLFLVGVSLTISFNRKKEGYRKRFLFRALKIFSFGLIITIFSLLVFPSSPIFFGILHLIGFSILLSIPIVNKKYLSLVLGILIITGSVIFSFSSLQIENLAFLGLSNPGPALDFFPVLPWFGVVLLGIFIGNQFYSNNKTRIIKPDFKIVDFIGFIGKNSLFIYFIHQPVLFSLVGIASLIF